MTNNRYDYHDAFTRGRAERRMFEDGVSKYSSCPYTHTDGVRHEDWVKGWNMEDKLISGENARPKALGDFFS